MRWCLGGKGSEDCFDGGFRRLSKWLRNRPDKLIMLGVRTYSMTNVTKGLQEIWQLGCAGEALTPPEAKHFSDLAASRFHTFILSAESAYQSKASDEAKAWVALLVQGLVTELVSNPGLNSAWHDSPFKAHIYGGLVSTELDKARIH